MKLLEINTNWLSNPSKLCLSVQAKETVTLRRVELNEALIQQQTGRPFRLMFEIGQIEELRSIEKQFDSLNQALNLIETVTSISHLRLILKIGQRGRERSRLVNH